ncbi:ABC transporter substrate-binding protein [Jiangella asiatica]|uniref:Extracellular solute-binding protein n=1 Tax=Jiangella asiatica TaxID=2530372 RepID=A0A4R5DST1_9ACTN|nr:extracellular solute-binding protein [Jiangella asiatica]TDE14185.1 extracellular solute-binding protein [Jiangella asiatica]
MTHNRRYRAACSALLGATMLVLAACGGGEDGGETSAGRDDEITVWKFGSPQHERDYYLERNQEFEAQSGLTVTTEFFDWDDRHQQVALANGSDNLPDIVVIENSMLAELATQDVIVPIAELTDDAEGRVADWSANYVQSFWDLGAYDGQLYGFSPYVDLSPMLIYNERMLAEAGVEPPQTWSELVDAAEALSADGRYGIAFGSRDTLDVDILESIAYMNGARWTDPESGEPAVAEDGWADTLQFMRDLAQYAPPGVTDQNFRDSLQLFYNEQAAMVITKSFAPVIAQDYDVPADFPDAVVEFPRPDSVTGSFEATNFVGQAAFLFTPTRQVNDADAVLDYLEFWAQPEQQAGWDGSVIAGRVPAAQDVLHSDVWAQQYPALAARADQVFAAVEPLPVFPGHASAQEDLREAFQAVLLGSLDPADAAESVDGAVQ